MIRIKHTLIAVLILIWGEIPVQAQRQVNSQGTLSCSRIIEMNYNKKNEYG